MPFNNPAWAPSSDALGQSGFTVQCVYIMGGSITTNVSGQTVQISGQVVQISGQVVQATASISGQVIYIGASGLGYLTITSGADGVKYLETDVSGSAVTTSVSGNIVQVSGQSVVTTISGNVVQASGQVVYIGASGLGYITITSGADGIKYLETDVSGSAVTTSVSGNIVQVSGQAVTTSVSGNVAQISGQIIYIGASGLGPITITSGADGVKYLETDVSGSAVTTSISGNIVQISGQSVVTSVSGNIIQVSGQIIYIGTSGLGFLTITSGSDGVKYLETDVSGSAVTTSISGNIVGVSGQIVQVSGQAVTISGNIVQVSGQAITVSGNIVQISGQAVTNSGSIVQISGQIMRVDPTPILIASGVVSWTSGAGANTRNSLAFAPPANFRAEGDYLVSIYHNWTTGFLVMTVATTMKFGTNIRNPSVPINYQNAYISNISGPTSGGYSVIANGLFAGGNTGIVFLQNNIAANLNISAEINVYLL